jgi:hypothetical protein
VLRLGRADGLALALAILFAGAALGVSRVVNI